MRRTLHKYIYIALIAAAATLCGCGSTKHVPAGMMLLDNVTINVDNDSIETAELVNFLRQQPNHKILGFAKLQLATYSLSGRDTTKWYNRWLRSMGQPPVIYDQSLTEKSRNQLQQALVNRGYMDVEVTVDSVARHDKKRIDITYNIATGQPHYIASVNYVIPDTTVAGILSARGMLSSLRYGELFDRNRLDQYRTEITQALRDHGYYDFNKEMVTFIADTVSGDNAIALTMQVRDRQYTPRAQGTVPADSANYSQYLIRHIYFVTDYNPLTWGDPSRADATDTVRYKSIDVIYGPDRYIKPQILQEKCFMTPGQPYSAREVENTYEALSQLSILKYINITMQPAGGASGTRMLDAYVLLSRNKKQGVIFEVEGTNSEGDLGFGVGATYQHRNLFGQSEMLTAKFRTSYESLSGNFNGLINNRYTEYAGELGISFPKFMMPLVPAETKRRMRATSEFALSANYQERPEYTRIIAGGAWKYKMNTQYKGYRVRHNFDLVDINYVKLPKSTLNFLDSIAPSNPLLRYSYEDHFIMRMGYTFNASNKRIATATSNAYVTQPSVTTLRGSVEVAGNLLYGLSNLFHQKKDQGAYKVLGIQYAQYVKAQAEYNHTLNLTPRSALAFHAGTGVAVPYGNSEMVPFEKRFYAGGANSVRGWSVRTLGPGSYDSRNSVVAFINQCGDVLLEMSMEYRAKLFWVFEGAVFIDGGNIWTIRDYETQPGGVFRLDKFYKQLAASYGAGVRLDFTYFLLRFDLGIKAHDPAGGHEPWPLLHPRWKRDATFHFAVGYPF